MIGCPKTPSGQNACIYSDLTPEKLEKTCLVAPAGSAFAASIIVAPDQIMSSIIRHTRSRTLAHARNVGFRTMAPRADLLSSSSAVQKRLLSARSAGRANPPDLDPYALLFGIPGNTSAWQHESEDMPDGLANNCPGRGAGPRDVRAS